MSFSLIHANELTSLDLLIRIFVAVLIGCVVGTEREYKNRPAGLRTHVLVCLGACMIALAEGLFTANIDTSTSSNVTYNFGRLCAQVISGIGFLGAGTIIKGDYGVRGLTTAASLWVVACIGLALGAGFYWGAIVGAALTYAALVFFKSVEEHAAHDVMRLRLCVRDEEGIAGQVVDTLLGAQASISEFHTRRVDGRVFMTPTVSCPKGARPPQLVEKLAAIPGVESVSDR